MKAGIFTCSEGVELPAYPIHFAGNFKSTPCRRSFEKHVFQKMRNPGFLCSFVSRADLQPDTDR